MGILLTLYLAIGVLFLFTVLSLYKYEELKEVFKVRPIKTILVIMTVPFIYPLIIITALRRASND